MSIGFKLYRRSAKRAGEHIAKLSAAGWAYQDIIAALRASTTCQTTSELTSSVEMSEREEKRVEKRGDNALVRLDKLARKYGGCAVYSGDPRGCPLLVDPKSDPTAWKPAPNLPATGWGGGYAID